jgi:CheY-like chemotaxis protein
MIKQHKPRIIVSDFKLPYMSGLALLQFVRNHPEIYNTPFLFLTNDAMPDEALGLGATAWVRRAEHRPEELLLKIMQSVN